MLQVTQPNRTKWENVACNHYTYAINQVSSRYLGRPPRPSPLPDPHTHTLPFNLTCHPLPYIPRDRSLIERPFNCDHGGRLNPIQPLCYSIKPKQTLFCSQGRRASGRAEMISVGSFFTPFIYLKFPGLLHIFYWALKLNPGIELYPLTPPHPSAPIPPLSRNVSINFLKR